MIGDVYNASLPRRDFPLWPPTPLRIVVARCLRPFRSGPGRAAKNDAGCVVRRSPLSFLMPNTGFTGFTEPIAKSRVLVGRKVAESLPTCLRSTPARSIRRHARPSEIRPILAVAIPGPGYRPLLSDPVPAHRKGSLRVAPSRANRRLDVAARRGRR